MKRFKVLITDRFHIEAFGYLKSQAGLEVMTATTHLPTAEELHEADALIIRSRTVISADFLERAPRLKVIVTATSGFDHIDFNATEQRKIVVMHTPNANAQSACEMTWSLILASARKVVQAHKAVKSGEWRSEKLTGSELHGKTIGIVGLGRIGSRVAKIAQAFGMKVIGFDPFKDDPYFSENQVTRLSFEEALKLSDVLSFHVPKTKETHHMVKRMNLEYIQRGIILVNTSRGSVIHEADLCEAIGKGWIGAVGLDVFDKEPLPRNSPLLNFANVTLTPHIGASTTEAFGKASHEAAEKIVAFLTQNQASDTLPPQEIWYHTPFLAFDD